MQTLKYTIIKTEEQYIGYCNTLENLIEKDHDKHIDEIELLTLLIEKWDNENNSFSELSPIELLKELLFENNLKSKDLVDILNLSKGTVSKIINKQIGLSKNSIRKLSNYFKISQEALNKPYKLVTKKKETVV